MILEKANPCRANALGSEATSSVVISVLSCASVLSAVAQPVNRKQIIQKNNVIFRIFITYHSILYKWAFL